ncbi:glutamine--tRNA ligase/YqeY domain fusion protein [Ralstonia solanacearum]|uniref:glutamine--tRNA ligase/YqeY domain fusion protein n=1 Tax=Ralstonia solanacearum TaxID=305 RepID=UPI0005C4B405|nr:glutamine--tRNA ligase/YqeY domain fusion protein [Ralstonia solanacearum]MBB6591765.1 glutamine--tRNA ligase/YqeY domain fusion protein [Ralstonia solanacearum]MBB6595988.1 glutamine--tRNA ligase/YqeY domain fusion protein [Ralstonia solanacearum]MDB0541136.1 glutamine--tRNA ligase/YqeY domain fusion protein [Ralstonia solanacearum]MDB0551385.1 glutamine--tRNA ligase/YqeY domain fusion protein [Ralstonia solanacearum]MDB0556085.1 glutamine--tRNA ligase/YqeY domain fusion protein [Ralstonia
MSQDNATGAAAASTSNFLRQIIDADLEQGTYAGRQDAAGQALPPIITRFPPEPNGYLHIGHAKSIWVNFGLAKEYGGRCHLRFDDTNPVKEDTEYVDSIIDAVHWLGYSWQNGTGEHLYYASDYFEQLYGFAEVLIRRGAAYIDSQSAEQIAASRGDFTRPGTPSPFRDRSVEENLALFRDMRAGKYQDGQHVLRAKIDMAAPNIVMRDPVLYRIRHAHHHRTGDAWCIYPMYDFTHCISDALENITHSLCTLEFENNRPLYDWVLDHLRDAGALPAPLPHQYEFARLHLTYAITSKRKLLQLVNEQRVDGWDDPRMPTLVGIRRRGYTPESIQLFCERVGVSKADSWIDMSILEAAVRDDLDARAPRSVAVLDPVKLILGNVPADFNEPCSAPVHPKQPELGRREFPLTRELWIEREDFTETPPKGYFRLFPGNKVRLRYGYVIECTGCDKDADGNITAVHANIIPDTKSGTPGADSVKVKGNIHWVSAAHALEAEVRLYDRLFSDPQPDSGDKNFLDALNPDSKRIVTAYLEPTLATAKREDRFQFERHGYFVADRIDSQPGKPVFNRVVGLKDSWGK